MYTVRPSLSLICRGGDGGTTFSFTSGMFVDCESCVYKMNVMADSTVVVRVQPIYEYIGMLCGIWYVV